MASTPDETHPGVVRFDKAMVEEWAKSTFGEKGMVCSLCGAMSWNVVNWVAHLTQYNRTSIVLGSPSIPVVVLTCQNCANTVLINAIQAGIMEKSSG